MDNFNRGKKFGGDRGGRKFGGKSFGGDRGGRSFGGGRDRGDRGNVQMHKAICDECKKNCEVPFRPTAGKPVLCSDCFKSKKSDSFQGSQGGGNRDFGRRDSKPRFDDRKPFQNDASRDSQNYKSQFEMLNAKLDKILKVLNLDQTGEKTETKYKKFERAPKKEIDITALKKVLVKTMDKPTVTAEKKSKTSKKPVVKKAVVKKLVAKKVMTKTKKTKTGEKKK
ncbi:MAG: hypothetical protein PHX25_03865 [Candidatus Pacebacteria bacterium]|nr:hypothetical protein [Candidatus Paceibacterota bacterium]